MKRSFLFFVYVICLVFATYSNNVADKVVIYNDWGIGLSVDYEIYTIESKIIANDTTITSIVTQNVTIELNDTTADGDLIFICRPSVKNRIADKTGMSDRYKELVERVDTMSIELLTDRYGSVLEIRNVEEIQENIRNSGLCDVVVMLQLEKYKEEHKNATSQELERVATVLSQVKEQMCSEQVVYMSAKDIMSLFIYNGSVLELGKEYIEHVKKPIEFVPDVNLNTVLKTKSERLNFEDDDRSFVKITRVTEFDKKQLDSVFLSMIKSYFCDVDESDIAEYINMGEVNELWSHLIDDMGVCLRSLYDFSITVGDYTIRKEKIISVIGIY